MMINRIMHVAGLVPGGHYALATSVNGLLFVSGLLPVRQGGDHTLANAPFRAQLEQVFSHLDAVLAQAGSSRDQVAKLSIYLADIALWSECNKLCADYFGELAPARCIVPVPSLHYGYQVEIEATVAMAG